MRTIKFRGKSTTNKEWKYGIPVNICDGTVIIEDGGVFNDGSASPFFSKWDFVKPETICQFTGLYDKNGKEIYEGDILTADHYPFMKDGKMNYLAVVEWFEEDACWYASMQLHKDSTARGISVNCPAEFDKVVSGLYEVTGNIHDNIDLLKDYER